MNVTTILEETYNLLNDTGFVNNKKQFLNDFLNRSESYIRVQKHNNCLPSLHTLVMCSSKLKYCSELLKRKKKVEAKFLAHDLLQLSKKYDDVIYAETKNTWKRQKYKKFSPC